MLHFIIGKAGCGKTHEIYQIIENLSSGKNAILLVPEQASFENERRMLSLPVDKRCEVLSFTRLCDRVFKTYGGIAGTPLTPQEKMLLMARSVEEVKDQLFLYRKQLKNPDFYTHVLAIVAECNFNGITPAALEMASHRVPGKGLQQKLKEIALISGVYNRLVEESYIDPDHQLEKAYGLLQDKDFWQGKTVFIDAFKDFTYPQKQLISQIISQADDVYLSLCADGEHSRGEFELFENTKDILAQCKRMAKEQGVSFETHCILTRNKRAKNPALKDMEAVLAGEDLTFEEDANEITICSCRDQYDQADYIARTVAKLVREEGYRYRDIMIIARDPAHYQGALEGAFASYEIPCFSDHAIPFKNQPLAAFCQKSMELVTKGMDTSLILSLLKTGLTPLSVEEVALLENYTFTWGTTGAQWLKEFNRHPDGAKEPSPAMTARLNNLRLQMVSPLLSLKDACKKGNTCKTYATALYEYLHSLQVFDRLQTLGDVLSQTQDAFAAGNLLRSPTLLVSLLDQMVRALGDTPLSLNDFTRYLGLTIQNAGMGTIPQGIDQVMMGDAAHTRPAQPKVVFLLNTNQGVFPGIPASGGLLTDYERAQLNQFDIPLSDHGQFDTVEESFLFYQAACSAKEKVFFTYLTENGGNLCTPLILLKDHFPHCVQTSTQEDSPLLQAVTPGTALELLAKRYSLKDAMTGSLYAYFEQHHPHLLDLCRRQTALPQCSLTPETANNLFGEDIYLSPSGVEVYHKCRFNYFCQYGLRVSPRQPIGLDVLSRGTLVHYVLEHIIRNNKETGLHALSPEEQAEQIHTLLYKFVEQEMGGTGDKSPTFLFQLKRVEALLRSLVAHMAKEMENSLFQTVACEYKIRNNDGDMPPVCFPLKNGGKLYITGVVDRIDTYEQNGITYIRIVDYKTGTKDFVLEDIYYGIGLQMLIYLFALEKDGVNLGELRQPAGILYMPAKRKSVEEGESSEKELMNSLKMKGLILNQDHVLHAMDPHKQGLYVPLTYLKDGGLSTRSSVASLEFFGKTRKHLEELLTQMGNALQDGDITCQPLDPSSSQASACDYCNYKGACPLGAEGVHDKVPKLSDEDKKALLKGGEYHGI